MLYPESATVHRGSEAWEALLTNPPDECPHCHRKGAFIEVTGRVDAKIQTLFVLLACPAHNCGKLFLGEFELIDQYRDAQFRLVSGGNPRSPEIPEVIRSLSARFCEVYKQAFVADHYGLSEVAGPGYRKALEILVKDYIISLTPGDAAKTGEIKSTPLAKCIEKYMDERLRRAAKRATWIGNDETHYERRWESKSLDDLKQLLALTIADIEANLLIEKYVVEMPD